MLKTRNQINMHFISKSHTLYHTLLEMFRRSKVNRCESDAEF
ncbi:hypothetical protein X975_24138, partial [Stegodyphus mimosarum]